ncbi:MAG: ATP-binding protein, partial [Paracoccaceae bacterium]
MNFSWLKRFLPRGLYGRAAMIILVPIVTLQLVISVGFIQRYYVDLTQQMTRNIALDLALLAQPIQSAGTPGEAVSRVNALAGPLRIDVSLPDQSGAGVNVVPFYDLSGRAFIRALKVWFEVPAVVDLTSDRGRVLLWVQTRHGSARMSFSRTRVSAINPHQFLVLLVLVSATMIFVAFIFLRNQLRPIRRLARAAEAFGKGRIEKYKPAGASEVRAAGRAFLDMRARIERQIEQRTLMLSGVSHDLRTPITRLKLGLSMLDAGAGTQELQRDVEDMERLLDEFLAFARGDALDDAVMSDPRALVRDAVARLAAAHGAVEIGSMSGAGDALLRPMAIGRALDNLVGNALRYGSRALIGVKTTARSVTISVQDDGPGIAAELRAEALKPFVRLDVARNQDQGPGVGLGLSIAHDIARRHGGSLQLGDSQKLGGLLVELI